MSKNTLKKKLKKIRSELVRVFKKNGPTLAAVYLGAYKLKMIIEEWPKLEDIKI